MLSSIIICLSLPLSPLYLRLRCIDQLFPLYVSMRIKLGLEKRCLKQEIWFLKKAWIVRLIEMLHTFWFLHYFYKQKHVSNRNSCYVSVEWAIHNAFLGGKNHVAHLIKRSVIPLLFSMMHTISKFLLSK